MRKAVKRSALAAAIAFSTTVASIGPPCLAQQVKVKPTSIATASKTARLLVFPPGKPVGDIYFTKRHFGGLWTRGALFAPAVGKVVVPATAGDIELVVHYVGLNDLSFLRRLNADDLQGLDLSNQGHGFPLAHGALSHIAHLRGLRQLNLEQADVGDDDIANIWKLTRLEALNLGHTELSSRGLAGITALRELRDLSLDGSMLDDKSFAVVSTLAELRVLFCRSCNLTAASAATIGKLQKLSVLRIDNNKLGDGFIAALPVMSNLVEIQISNSKISEKSILAMSKFPYLERVFAKDSILSERVFAWIAASKTILFADLASVPYDFKTVAPLAKSVREREIWLLARKGDEAAIRKAAPKIKFTFKEARSKVPLELFEPLH